MGIMARWAIVPIMPIWLALNGIDIAKLILFRHAAEWAAVRWATVGWGVGGGIVGQAGADYC